MPNDIHEKVIAQNKYSRCGVQGKSQHVCFMPWASCIYHSIKMESLLKEEVTQNHCQ